MATIYTKTTTEGSDKTLILQPREAMNYEFSFPGGWTELRLGFTGGVVDDDSANVMSDAPEGSQFITNGVVHDGSFFKDRIVINGQRSNCPQYGLKTSNGLMPGSAGTKFAGMTFADNVANGFAAFDYNQPSLFYLRGSTGINRAGTIINGVQNLSQLADLHAFFNTNGANVASQSWFAYATRTFMKFTIGNRGLPGQTITIEQYHQLTNAAPGVVLDKTITSLRAGMASSPYNLVAASLPIPGDLPNAFFFYLPFTSCRYRFSSIAVERYS